MVDNPGPPAGPPNPAEAQNPNRLVTPEEERAFKASLVDLRDDLIDRRPDLALSGELQAVDQDGASIEFEFEADHEFSPGKIINGLSLWYETPPEALTERSEVSQQRRVAVTLSAEEHWPLKDGFLHYSDKTVLLDSEGKEMLSDREERRHAELQEVKTQYDPDDPELMRALLEVTLKHLPEEIPGENDGLKLEQLQVLEHSVSVLRASLDTQP